LREWDPTARFARRQLAHFAAEFARAQLDH